MRGQAQLRHARVRRGVVYHRPAAVQQSVFCLPEHTQPDASEHSRPVVGRGSTFERAQRYPSSSQGFETRGGLRLILEKTPALIVLLPDIAGAEKPQYMSYW